MKKLLVMLLSAMLVLSGCGENKKEISADAVEKSAETELHISYEGLNERNWVGVKENIDSMGINMNEKEEEAARVLYFLGHLEKGEGFKGLDETMLLHHVLDATKNYTVNPKVENYNEALKVVVDELKNKNSNVGMTDYYLLGDHVIKTGKMLLGDDFEVDLKNAVKNGYAYYEEEGLLELLPQCGGYVTYPLIKNLEEKDGTVDAEVLYLFDNMNGLTLWGKEERIPFEEAKAFLENTDETVHVILERQKDGRLIFKELK